MKSFEIFLLLNVRTMANNFSLSYVLNQFLHIVMFGMKGFYISASGAILGHHGPLVSSSHNVFYPIWHLVFILNAL